MAQKIVISKPGYTVTPSLEDRYKVFDSDLNHLKTFYSGVFTEELADSEDVVISYTHSLGYTPLTMGYFRDTANNKWFITMSDISGLGRYSVPFSVSLYADTTKVYFRLINNATPRTAEVKYEIFYEGSA